MKKIIIALLIASGGIFTSCEDISSDNLSRVTIYPIVTMNGDNVVVLTQGDSFTDDGASALSGSDELEITTTGSVDATTPGVYKITYTASNTDGFDASQTRTIIVLSSAPSAFNLEGTFLRNGNENHVVRISDRVYTSDNAGGIAPPTTPLEVTFYNIDDQHLYIPPQTTNGIDVESEDGTLVNNNRFTWVLIASGVYGTAVRNFTR